MHCGDCEGDCFNSQRNVEEKREHALMAYEFSREVLTGGKYDLVILDEFDLTC
ncbi:MAG: hypothetical protein Q7I94_04745 [Candidatus Contubernalis sp.]|nr:hypothetical protein [Candidatus Contubernalis sp.]